MSNHFGRPGLRLGEAGPHKHSLNFGQRVVITDYV